MNLQNVFNLAGRRIKSAGKKNNVGMLAKGWQKENKIFDRFKVRFYHCSSEKPKTFVVLVFWVSRSSYGCNCNIKAGGGAG